MTATTDRPARPIDADAPGSLRATVSPRCRLLIVVGILLGMLLASLDQTVVGTAMPRVIAELGGLAHYAWVFTAYMLTATVMVPIYGKLSDIYGRRPFFLGGMALFLLGSALSGLSQDMTQLILFRGVQGLGAGAMMPIVQAIVGDIFPPAERGKWQGLMMAVFGLSSIVGPAVGGWITDTWGWRWVFYVNMPVGALAILTAGFALPRQVARREHTIDYPGALTLVAAAVPLLLAFSWGGTEYAWASAPIVGLLVFAAAMTVLFILIETRAAEPIINPDLFANRIFTVSVVASFLVSVGMFGAIMYLPLFVQGVLGNSATSSGAVTAPMMVGFMVSSLAGGQVLARTGRYRFLAIGGFAVAAVGMWLLSRMDVATPLLVVSGNMVVTGLGIGVMMSLFTIVVQNAFPFSRLGQVTASLQFFRSIGGTIGVAVLGTVMANRFQTALQANLPDSVRQAVPPDRLIALQNPQALLAPAATAQMEQSFASFGAGGQALFEQLLGAIRLSLAGAITDLFLFGAGTMLLALVVVIFLPEIPLRQQTAARETVPAELARIGVELAPGALDAPEAAGALDPARRPDPWRVA